MVQFVLLILAGVSLLVLAAWLIKHKRWISGTITGLLAVCIVLVGFWSADTVTSDDETPNEATPTPTAVSN